MCVAICRAQGRAPARQREERYPGYRGQIRRWFAVVVAKPEKRDAKSEYKTHKSSR